MYYLSIVAVCLVASAFADPLFPGVIQDWQQGGGAAGNMAGGGLAGSAGQAAQQAGNSAAAQQSAAGAQASRIEASGANREEAAAGLRRRQSVLLAADQEEGAGYEGSSAASAAAGGSAKGGSYSYCGGIAVTDQRHLCCADQYYGDASTQMSCCGNTIFDTGFYGCDNNVLSPLYRPQNSQPSNFQSGFRPTRLCGNYVWQLYDDDLCCDGIYYKSNAGRYSCCGARAYDNRYYNCGHDEVKQKWYVYKRSTFVLAATEELEAVGSRKSSGVGRIAAEEGAVASSQASASAQDAARAAADQTDAQAAGQQAASGNAGYGANSGAASAYSPYYGGYGAGAAGYAPVAAGYGGAGYGNAGYGNAGLGYGTGFGYGK